MIQEMSMTQEQTNSPSVIHRRGDVSPVDSSLVFLRYKRGKEVWVSRDHLERAKAQSRVVCAKQRAKPGHKEMMKLYFRDYNKRPHQKARMKEYYSRDDVKERRRDQWASDPEMRRKAMEYKRTPKAKNDRKIATEKKRQAMREMTGYIQVEVMSAEARRVSGSCRARIRESLRVKQVRKKSKARDLLGCSFEFFRGWLESKFLRGMSWQNYGVFWHIDHITPISHFNIEDEEQQKLAFHYTNCQPLWADLNLKKNNKLMEFDHTKN